LGAQLNELEYVGNDFAQQFNLVDIGNGWFKIQNVKSGFLHDVIGGSTANGAAIQQYADDGTDAQLWRLCLGAITTSVRPSVAIIFACRAVAVPTAPRFFSMTGKTIRGSNGTLSTQPMVGMPARR
jgi:hypothetical protein